MAKAPPKKQAGTGMLLGMFAVFALIILALVSMASVVMVLFGCLPTFVAILVDRSPQRFAALSVFAMNFAGLFPYLLDLWMGSNSMSVAIDSLTDVFTLFTIFGSAAVGWVLFAITPPIVTAAMTFMAQRRVSVLRARQKKLLEEWGEDVTGEKHDSHKKEDDDSEPDFAPKAPKT